MSMQTTSQRTIRTIRRLQAQIATINDNIADMTRTELRIADRYGWLDERIERIDADIELAQEVRDELVAELHDLQRQGHAA